MKALKVKHLVSCLAKNEYETEWLASQLEANVIVRQFNRVKAACHKFITNSTALSCTEFAF